MRADSEKVFQTYGSEAVELPIPVEDGGLESDAAAAFGEAMRAHLEIDGMDDAVVLAGHHRVPHLIDMSRGPGRLLVRTHDVSTDGTRVSTGAEYVVSINKAGDIKCSRAQSGSLGISTGSASSRMPEDDAFFSADQKNAFLSFIALHNLRLKSVNAAENWMPLKIELIEVHGAPHLVVTEHQRRFRQAEQESAFALNALQMAQVLQVTGSGGTGTVEAIQFMHEVDRMAEHQVREVPVDARSFTWTRSADSNADGVLGRVLTDDPSGDAGTINGVPIRIACGAAVERVLERIEAGVLEAHIDGAGLDVEMRDQLANVSASHTAAMLAAGAKNSLFASSALVLDGRPVANRPAAIISPQNGGIRPDVVVDVHRGAYGGQYAPWVAEPYAIDDDGGITRGDMFWFESGLAHHEQRAEVTAQAAQRMGLTAEPPTEMSDEQGPAVQALLDVLASAKAVGERAALRNRDETPWRAGATSIVLDSVSGCLLEAMDVRGEVDGAVEEGTEFMARALRCGEPAVQLGPRGAEIEYISSAGGRGPGERTRLAVQNAGAVATRHRCVEMILETAEPAPDGDLAL